MKKSEVLKLLKDVQNGLKKHSPEILTAVGIVGMVTTTIMAVKATPKAMKLIDDKKEELELKPDESLTPVETVKTAWKPFVPVVVTGVASMACIVGASSLHVKRNAALMTAYQISTTALNEFKEKAVETIGEEKVKEVTEKIKSDKKEKLTNPSDGHNTYIINTDEEILIKEPLSNQVFRSTMMEVEQKALSVSKRIIKGSEYSISLNEFLAELHLKPTPIGDDIGWNVDHDIDITFDDGRTDSNKPCFVIAYLQPPVHGFNKYF